MKPKPKPKPKPAPLIVFDLDGTLIDSLTDLASAVNSMIGELAPGTPALSLAEVRSFVGDGARQLVSKSLGARGVSAALEDALPIFLGAYRRGLLSETRLYDGVAEMLDALRLNHTLAVLSNKPGEMCRAILEGLGVAACFARVWGGDDAPKKPDPAGLLRLISELGATKSTTAMVGDSANDVKTAMAAGVRCVGVSYGFDPVGMAAARPAVLVASPAELERVLLHA